MYDNIEFKSLVATDLKTDGRTLIGYAASFGNVDYGGDMIKKGAFARTINNNKDKIKTFYNHEFAIGKPVLMREDEKGLYTESVISKTAKGDEVLELVKDGVITDMSLRYKAVKSSRGQKGERILEEMMVKEFGPVDFGMNNQAVVLGVKSLADKFKLSSVELKAEDIQAINDEINKLQQLVESYTKSNSDNSTSNIDPLQSTQWMSQLGDSIHQLAESVRCN